MGGISNLISSAFDLVYISPIVSMIAILILAVIVGKAFSNFFDFGLRVYAGSLLGAVVAAGLLNGIDSAIVKNEEYFGLARPAPRPYAENTSDYIKNDCFKENLIAYLSKDSSIILTVDVENALLELLAYEGNAANENNKILMNRISDFVRATPSIDEDRLKKIVLRCYVE